MRLAVLTEDAERDLEELHDYVADNDTAAKAAHLLDRIENTLENLSNFPERGAHPKELLALGIRDYRQTYFKPYRMIYRIIERRVYIYLIVNGRRDLQTLLARRLFGA